MTNPTPEQISRLREVFEMVQNRDHWKNPVDAVIPCWSATQEEIREAVIFFTGSVPTITPEIVYFRHVTGTVYMGAPGHHVQAAGYYAAIGC